MDVALESLQEVRIGQQEKWPEGLGGDGETGVLCVHGSGFGMAPEDGYLRIVFLTSPEELRTIYGLIADFTREYLR